MTPCDRVRTWVTDAREADLALPEAMTLATADRTGAPSARTVLLREIEGDELLFGTTLRSLKGRQLLANPLVALVLHWPALGRQIRIAGVARPGGQADAERLWAGRGRDARLVDAVSDEGAPVDSLDRMRDAFARADAEHGDEVPRPPGWAAVRVRAEIVEFWSAGERRLAEREEFVRGEEGWARRWLQP